jgi:hypothetical protein
MMLLYSAARSAFRAQCRRYLEFEGNLKREPWNEAFLGYTNFQFQVSSFNLL